MTDTALTDEEIAALGGLFLGVGAVVLVVALVWYIINVIAMWRLFKKAGEPGWKSLIPIYNGMVLYDKVWDIKWFWINVLVAVVASFANNMVQEQVAVTAMTVLSLVALIAAAVLLFFFNQKLAAAFGKSQGFGVGLWLLNPIFMLILSFGGSTYQGKGKNA